MSKPADLDRCRLTGCPVFWSCRRGLVTARPEAWQWLLPEPEDLTTIGCRYHIPDNRLEELCEGLSCHL
ncbi:MAG: hypothetical protein V1797_11105 [Pseudomonadota bacterium]